MSSGTRRTRGVCGWYCSSSNTGAAARPPRGQCQVGADLEGVGGHHGWHPWRRGQVGGEVSAPRMRLPPPESTRAFQKTGLASGLLLGASACTRLSTTSASARRRATAGRRRPAAARRSARLPGRLDEPVQRVEVQAGSVKRRSRGGGARVDPDADAGELLSQGRLACSSCGRRASPAAERMPARPGRNRRSGPSAAAATSRSRAAAGRSGGWPFTAPGPWAGPPRAAAASRWPSWAGPASSHVPGILVGRDPPRQKACSSAGVASARA